jgi:hypothetical protein
LGDGCTAQSWKVKSLRLKDRFGAAGAAALQFLFFYFTAIPGAVQPLPGDNLPVRLLQGAPVSGYLRLKFPAVLE